MDFLDAQPVQHVGHQLLEAHVLHPRHALGAQEVFVGAVTAELAFARVVDQELGDFTERAAFLAAVGDEAHAALLRTAYALFNGMREVGAAGADVGAKNVRAVAFVVHARRQFNVRVSECADVAKHVERLAADGGQEDFEIAARHQLGVHAAGFLEERAAQVAFAHAKALGHTGQPPHGLDGDLGHRGRGVVHQDAAVDLQALEGQRLLDLGQMHMRLRHRDGRADVIALRHVVGVDMHHARTPGVDRDHLAGVAPLRVGAHQVGGRGVRKVGAVASWQVARRHGECAVHAVAAAVRADDVALAAVGGGAHDGAARQRIGRAPGQRRRAARALAGV